ncbi:MAG: DUF1800 domain-containing protein [Fimbriimonadaceae bacterium]|nr:DUF1800 domain-containing protein [Chitinophagales bacterium]
MISHQQKIQHLYLRAAFGEKPDIIQKKSRLAIEKNVDELFVNAQRYLSLKTMEDPIKSNGRPVSNLKILFMILRSKEETLKMNVDWLNMMSESASPLREKMTFFWHNHFATSTPFAWLMQVQNNTLRKNSLSSFRKLLHAVAKDPAMIIYLNNHQNKKDAPNENFAREVMELFTLGEGNIYTEKDIKEAARAFTGWTVNKKGEYEFEKEDHDFGEKEFLGRKGNFNGEEILDIILQQKQTANHIASKIYKEFVNEEVDEEIVANLAEEFYTNDYDIKKLMEQIFVADWFYDEKNIGSKISSPVELIVRYKKLINFDVKRDDGLFYMQRLLGQTLFFPPSVAGWKGGKNWIDSSSLFLRMNMPARILNDGGFDVRPKPEFEDVSDDTMLKTKKKASVQSDWNGLVRIFEKVKKEDLTQSVLDAFIQSPQTDIDKSIIEKYMDHSSDEKRIISTCAAVFSLPEFQLI